MHETSHPLAGQTVKLNDTTQKDNHGTVSPGMEYRIEDWWDKLTGSSWMWANGNPAALSYAVRSMRLPIDNEVVYGKIGSLGYLIHVSELGDLV